ncbi:ABC transporter ATP-binding protein [uncultured Clostridium sp.]|jgi:cobalt/nickel transport system ATP-binding protein|uniref:energy-coupling factor ABC transporter ATP-binding protein n=1 Tax=uncultured Clostridium sp. TaxID=59620 RepID=UPI002609B36C|nr:ABC transporter ATP-binding protein [uncultured Clostridium sp.]
MIKMEKVCFAYKDTIALKNIDLEIEAGEGIALIGANGSGKSTLLKLINGVVNPTKGKYIFDGEEINEKFLNNSKNAKKFHQKVGFVFQNSDAQLFNSTVYDEIAFGPRQMGYSEDIVEKRVMDCLDLLGIEKLKDRQPYNLSGGEKKKVAMASVLSLNPDVLVLDEPMNEIDPKGKRFLRDFLIKLRESGKTIICSTHEFAYVEGVFNRVVVFSENHEIIRDGEYHEVLEDKEFLINNNIL